jgi:hypothetical protein
MGLKTDKTNHIMNLQKDKITTDISLVYFHHWKGNSSEEQLFENMCALLKNPLDLDFKQVYVIMRVDLGVLGTLWPKV